MSRRRFFVSAFEGASATLVGEQAYHLGRVLRARAGQLYELSNGQQVWLAQVNSVARDNVRFELVERLPTVERALAIVLLAAIVKFDRLEWLLAKATELGVIEIQPVVARRSDLRLVRTASKRRARWEKIMLESAQQARRLRLPVLLQPVPLARAIAGLEADLKLLLSESPQAPPIKHILRAGAGARRVALGIGPEGGWTPEELRTAAANGFQAVSLGPYVLRTETAVIAALATVGYELD